MKNFVELVVKLVINTLISIPLYLWAAWVLTKLWLWFIVPGFGLRPIDVIAAMGLLFVVRLATTREGPDDRSVEEIRAAKIAYALSIPLIFLCTGATVHFLWPGI